MGDSINEEQQSENEKKEPSTSIANDISTQKTVEAVGFPKIVPLLRRPKEGVSRSALVVQATIHTHPVQLVFTHYFSRTDWALYDLTKGLNYQKHSREAKVAVGVLDEMFEVFSSELAVYLKDLEIMVESRVPKGLSKTLAHSLSRNYDVPVQTGYAMRLVNMTSQLDSIVALTEILELSCVLRTIEASQTLTSWIKRYRTFCRAIQALRKETFEAIRATSSDKKREVK